MRGFELRGFCKRDRRGDWKWEGKKMDGRGRLSCWWELWELESRVRRERKRKGRVGKLGLGNEKEKNFVTSGGEGEWRRLGFRDVLE